MTMTLSAEAPGALARDIAAACDRIAPTWPLDRFIAVNPYWGWRAASAPDAAARLGALAGTALTMPRAWFRAEAGAGRLDPHHVDAVAGDPVLALAARAVLDGPGEPVTPTVRRLALVTDVRDGGPGPVPGRTWTELVVHQIGQHCAAWFDEWQASWAPVRDTDLFRAWRSDPSVTHGFPWRHGRAWARTRLDALPASSPAAIAVMLDDLGVPPSGHEAYLTAALLSVNGWAAWCSYRRWQARLDGADDDAIVDLLAVRLAWEWLLAADDADVLEGWAATWAHVDAHVAAQARDQRVDWVLQAAAERTYQDSIIGGLSDAVAPSAPPEAVAVFCIDVRSEVFRRALETVAPAVHTRGFAGFFGLPIAYTPAGSALTRPQLPGLLAPALAVSEDVDGAAAERAPVLAAQQREHAFHTDPSSAFSFVETAGLAYVAKLVQQSFAGHDGPERWEHEGLDLGPAARPRLALVDDDPAGAAALGRRVLTAMGLVADFPPVVLLCGHGSHATNNPHAHGLDCGACGGQSGEVNARVLADLLNASAVRRELAALGVPVPDRTWFVPALHDTTTDHVELFDTDVVPSSHRARLDQLVSQLRGAGARARAERAVGLGLGDLVARPQVLERRVTGRANDWSEVRPEWGLAGNAACATSTCRVAASCTTTTGGSMSTARCSR